MIGISVGRSFDLPIFASVGLAEGWLVGWGVGNIAGAERVVREGKTNECHANLVWLDGLGGWQIDELMVHECSAGGMIDLVVVVVVVITVTHPHNTGRVPITLEWKKYVGKIKTSKQ